MTDSSKKPLTRDLAPFGLRMQPDLKARVQAAAEANNRSMNAEIVALLEKNYPADPSRHPFLQGLMGYVQNGGTVEEMRNRASEANSKIRGSPFAERFSIGVIDMPTLPDRETELCPALFERTKKDDGSGYTARLAWWVSRHHSASADN